MSGLEQRPALLSHVTQHGRTTAPKSRYADSTARTFLRSCLFFSLFGKLQGSLLDRRKEILSVLSATAARSKMLLRVRVEPAVELAVHDEERTDDLFGDAIEIHLGEHLCELVDRVGSEDPERMVQRRRNRRRGGLAVTTCWHRGLDGAVQYATTQRRLREVQRLQLAERSSHPC